MKRTKLKRKSKTEVAKLKDCLWEHCKRIIRKKYGNVCFTCGKKDLVGAGWHTGHFIPKSVCGANLKYDLRNLRPQCYYCNINCGGQGALFYKKLVEIEGQDYVDQLFKDKNISIKADEIWYKQKIEEYESL